MKTRALMTSVGLSLLFVVVYSSTNWLASQRTNVGTWYYEWERFIPFVPIMVLPYMSIDVFFVLAPFLCRNRDELAIFTKRICFAIIFAGICFTLFPLRLSVERHPIEGWLGAIFNPFLAMDKPHNLLPSLHIALRTILAHLYARKSTGWVNAMIHVWFSLIGLSTLLTHQHHIVDVVGGFVLALYAMYLIHPHGERLPVVPNRRVAGCYFFLALLMTFAAAATWREGILLLWIATSAAIATVAYLGVGPGIYRKSDGRLPPSAKFALGPILIGQYLSLLYYRRQCRPWDRVVPGVLIGRRLNDRLANDAVAAGVTAVLDLTAEFSEAKPFLGRNYRNMPILDLTAPTLEQMHEMAEFIEEQAEKGDVYVHCKIGYSRSAAAVGAYLLRIGLAQNVVEACEQLRAVRPSIVIRPEILQALDSFALDVRANHS